MKITLASFFASMALAFTALGQSPTPPSATPAPEMSPGASAPETAAVTASVTPPASAILTPAATVAPAATLTPTVAPSASPDTEEDFDKAIERKINKHLKVAFDGEHSGRDSNSDGDHWWIPLVILTGCLTFFGTPVAIVATIMYFSFSRSRAMHKTVQMMVEKGQPVPEALLNPPPVVRQRSDLRRGVVLLMVGAGLMVSFGAFWGWESGSWSLGIVPFLIGAGYLLVWKLDVRSHDTSPKV